MVYRCRRKTSANHGPTPARKALCYRPSIRWNLGGGRARPGAWTAQQRKWSGERGGAMPGIRATIRPGAARAVGRRATRSRSTRVAGPPIRLLGSVENAGSRASASGLERPLGRGRAQAFRCLRPKVRGPSIGRIASRPPARKATRTIGDRNEERTRDTFHPWEAETATTFSIARSGSQVNVDRRKSRRTRLGAGQGIGDCLVRMALL